ncbi:MAG: hypothetical protein LBN24_03545 [Mediterranea sp.]|jgi:hypothetical protein|nr:hypothetical protein [Mediterranea sp.]
MKHLIILRNSKRALLTLLAFAALTGCDPHDPIYEADPPTPPVTPVNKLTFIPEWKTSQQERIPHEYITRFVSTEEEVYDYKLPPSRTSVDNDRKAGEYTVYAFNEPAGVVSDGLSFYVNYDADDADEPNEPGWLFTSSRKVKIADNQDNLIDLPMTPQIGILHIEVECANPTGVTAVMATLSGLARAFHLEDSSLSDAIERDIPLTQGTDGKWRADIHILGFVDEDLQNERIWLSGEIQYINTSRPFDENVWSQVKDFNQDKASDTHQVKVLVGME